LHIWGVIGAIGGTVGNTFFIHIIIMEFNSLIYIYIYGTIGGTVGNDFTL
jgi:hypothetical protein